LLKLNFKKEVFMGIKQEVDFKGLKNIINNMQDSTIVIVDLRSLVSDENVMKSVTMKRGDNNGRD
jgi:hypothetical protein